MLLSYRPMFVFIPLWPDVPRFPLVTSSSSSFHFFCAWCFGLWHKKIERSGYTREMTEEEGEKETGSAKRPLLMRHSVVEASFTSFNPTRNNLRRWTATVPILQRVSSHASFSIQLRSKLEQDNPICPQHRATKEKKAGKESVGVEGRRSLSQCHHQAFWHQPQRGGGGGRGGNYLLSPPPKVSSSFPIRTLPKSSRQPSSLWSCWSTK